MGLNSYGEASSWSAYSFVGLSAKVEELEEAGCTVLAQMPLKECRLVDSVASLVHNLYKASQFPKENWLLVPYEEAKAIVGTHFGISFPEDAPCKPAKKKAQLPPEVWATPIQGMDYMAAVRAMCGEAKHE